jgi:hypothetical protein
VHRRCAAGALDHRPEERGRDLGHAVSVRRAAAHGAGECSRRRGDFRPDRRPLTTVTT